MIFDEISDIRLLSGFKQLNTPVSTVHYFKCIDSTNKFLLENKLLGPGSVCVAEQQSNGRGQFGREWVSAELRNLYASILWEYDLKQINLTLLPYVLALAVAQYLIKLGYPVKVKWPNDLYLNRKKLAGILIETICNYKMYVVAGLGLNLYAPILKGQDPTETSGLLDFDSSVLKLKLNSVFCTEILNAFLIGLRDYIHLKQTVATQWQEYDLFYGQRVTWMSEGKQQKGVGQGINNVGAYRVLTDRGMLSLFHSDVKLRLA